jgi:hypothetical protein
MQPKPGPKISKLYATYLRSPKFGSWNPNSSKHMASF